MFKKSEIIKFRDDTRLTYTIHPIQRAAELPLNCKKAQEQNSRTEKFQQCPGMIEYKNMGYIVPAWDDIYIKASSNGIISLLGSMSKKRKSMFKQPSKMSPEMVKGIFKPLDNVIEQPLHFGAPWSIHVTDPKICALLLPPFYHATWIDDLYMYPGIVNYGKFTTINFICAAKREGEFLIKAGEPLIHVIPTVKSTEVLAEYGPSSNTELDKSNSIFSSVNQFYRKYISKPSKYKLTFKP